MKSSTLGEKKKLTTKVNNSSFNECLEVNINHELIKLNLRTKNVLPALKEINKILLWFDNNDASIKDELFALELRELLSDEFINNKTAINFFKKYLSMEENYIVLKETIPATEELDLINNKKLLRINISNIKSVINKIVSKVNSVKTRHILIHIKGLISEEDQLIIVDNLHQFFPSTKIKAFVSKQDIENKVMLELVFFGDFDGRE